jgi:ribulose-phosphate 3-epimerase
VEKFKGETMFQIWPSLISADLLHLATVMNNIQDHCYGWHLDIMDNHFVPNLTWGAQFVNAIAKASSKPLWVHLMIDEPDRFLEKLHIPKNSYVTFHVETESDINMTIKAIKHHGWRVSLAINPETKVETLLPYLHNIDQVLIMSVHPGFSGQAFITDTFHKIELIKDELKKENVSILLAIDGGINRENIQRVAELGVTQFGIAAGIFSTSNPVHELDYLKRLLAKI